MNKYDYNYYNYNNYNHIIHNMSLISIPNISSLLYPRVKIASAGHYIIFADDVASGRPCKKIEKKIARKVLPYYANTHSNAYCGILMKKMIQETREYLCRVLNVPASHKILFTGNGCTGAVNHLINSIDYSQYAMCNIYITAYEHYSNYLPWVELAKKTKGMQVIVFEKEIHLNNSVSCLNIISVSACSNVTGQLTDIAYLQNIRQQYRNTYLFLDMAASAPYVKIDISAMGADAVFISPHKFLGGPGTSGMLIADEKLFTSSHPYCPGGGCVINANSKKIIYENSLERKEVGGTPNIIGIIKTQYVFKLKEKLMPIIEHNEQLLVRIVYTKFAEFVHKYNIVIIGGTFYNNRLPIVSFSIPGAHYNLIVALLNDNYGVQSRGGINCCGLLAEKIGISGWCRLSFNYLMSISDVNYVLNAVEEIINTWPSFVGKYDYSPEKNLFMLK